MCKQRYVPDLTQMISECEFNYARLLKLMPEIDGEDHYLLGVSGNGHSGHVTIDVTERFKYTTTLKITQQDKSSDWLKKPSLTIRLYHDAQMAEVVDSNNMRQLKGVYPYPNRAMYHSDEKSQLNTYLSEWLRHCLNFGHVLHEYNFA